MYSDHYIIANIYNDPTLLVPTFTADQFDWMDEQTVSGIINNYNAAMECCSDYNIRKLAMQPFFQQYFQLAGDSFRDFFGKPIAFLTDNQLSLLRDGAHFRHIYATHDVSVFPNEVMQDPDLLTEYAAAAEKGKQDMQKQGAYEDDSMVVGMKKEDRKVLGVKKQGPNMSEIMQKHGGNVLEYLKNQG